MSQSAAKHDIESVVSPPRPRAHITRGFDAVSERRRLRRVVRSRCAIVDGVEVGTKRPPHATHAMRRYSSEVCEHVEGAEENVGETLRHNFLPSLGGLDQL